MLQHGDYKVCQKAMQVWCLIRSLPFLLEDKIVDTDEHMELIRYLLEIMEIVFAPKIKSISSIPA